MVLVESFLSPEKSPFDINKNLMIFLFGSGSVWKHKTKYAKGL